MSTNDSSQISYVGVEKLITQYAYAFYNHFKLQDTFQLLKFNTENLKRFSSNFRVQTNKIIGKMKSGHYPDRHKIVAAALKSFITAEVFRFAEEKYQSLKTDKSITGQVSINILYPNEMFAIDIIAFFTNQYALVKEIPEYQLRLPDKIYNYASKEYHCYCVDLFVLLHGYTQQKLDFAIQEFAHIIFFMEMGYEISQKELKDRYYSVG